jgi:hypothetical protein
MDRSGWVGLTLLFCAACSGTSGTNSTGELPPGDAGIDGEVPVNLDGGGAPATPPDGASLCPAGTCNYQTGAGCSGATPSCIPALSGGATSPACSPAGAGTSGAACSQPTDCAPGHMCAGNVCRKLCCGGDWTGCDSESEHCLKRLVYSDGMGGKIDTGAMLCFPVNDCDPLVPTSCTTAGTTCQLADATGAVACLPEGTGGQGDPCPCKGGYTCVVASKGPVCVRLCGAVLGGAPPYCQEGEGICTHYTHDPPGVGECAPP